MTTDMYAESYMSEYDFDQFYRALDEVGPKAMKAVNHDYRDIPTVEMMSGEIEPEAAYKIQDIRRTTDVFQAVVDYAESKTIVIPQRKEIVVPKRGFGKTGLLGQIFESLDDSQVAAAEA